MDAKNRKYKCEECGKHYKPYKLKIGGKFFDKISEEAFEVFRYMEWECGLCLECLKNHLDKLNLSEYIQVKENES